ncbi:aminoglycoside phosphotransferase family protein [Roseivivax marinus]|uniref:aminoglycoside phosphotransferase family protein n=1 Tax=Roseivivax marinus TaxID=1379903 RepID=UPI0012FE9CD7|nr:aminoglycoside phosphotransferase family protein [Roseivivax marinus]
MAYEMPLSGSIHRISSIGDTSVSFGDLHEDQEEISKRCRAVASMWQLDIQRLVEQGRLAWVWQAHGPRGPCALKLYRGSNMGSEGNAVRFLQCLDPEDAVQVYDIDLQLRAVLIEWLPGPSLSEAVGTVGKEAAVEIIFHLAQRIRHTNFGDVSSFNLVRHRLLKLERAQVALDSSCTLTRDISRAQTLSHMLRREPNEQRAIHGDLRFENVILTPDGPRLIDPKAQVGETAFEAAHAVWYSAGSHERGATIQARAERYAEHVGTTPKRLLQWAAVKRALYISFQSGGVITSASERHVPLLSCLLDLAEA